jgi:hypothetical protein
VSDGLDVKAMLSKQFTLQSEGRPAAEQTSQPISELTFWASFTKRD